MYYRREDAILEYNYYYKFQGKSCYMCSFISREETTESLLCRLKAIRLGVYKSPMSNHPAVVEAINTVLSIHSL